MTRAEELAAIAAHIAAGRVIRLPPGDDSGMVEAAFNRLRQEVGERRAAAMRRWHSSRSAGNRRQRQPQPSRNSE